MWRTKTATAKLIAKTGATCNVRFGVSNYTLANPARVRAGQ
jgi:hypothetical protein